MTSMGGTESNESRASEAEIQRTLGIFTSNGRAIEMRALGPGRRVASGYYNDPTQLARDATSWSGEASGIYLPDNES
jgi:hypothetical protein